MQGTSTTSQIMMFEDYLTRRFGLTSIQAETVIISLQRVLRARQAKKAPRNVIIFCPKNKYFHSRKEHQG